jgi:hypothetical protein
MSERDSLSVAQARRLAARLVHDVGKQVARTARNVGDTSWTPELAAMMARDLYALPAGRASAVFGRLAEATVAARPALGQVRVLLAEIDELEEAVRAGEISALIRAARAARAIEDLLRAHARELSEEDS